MQVTNMFAEHFLRAQRKKKIFLREQQSDVSFTGFFFFFC